MGGLPGYSGIFFVYNCRYDLASDTVTLFQILYIGEADNIRTRVATHERFMSWRSFVKEGNELCFSAAFVQPHCRTAVKAVLIFRLKPAANSEYKGFLPFSGVEITLAGKTNLLLNRYSTDTI